MNKFKLGDRVQIVAPDSVFKGKIGVVVSLKKDLGLLVKFGKKELFFEETELEKINEEVQI